jgi:hypothetical protein
VKHKVRRDERLALTGLRRNREGRVEAILVARRRLDGSLAGAGSIELGLRPELVEALERRLEARRCADAEPSLGIPPRSRWSRGLPDGPARDAMLREVVDKPHSDECGTPPLTSMS